MRKIAVAIVCLLALSGATCEQRVAAQATFDMQRVPQHYRACVEKVVALPKGAISRAAAVALLAKVRASELRHSACGKGVIRWADAQFDAYQKAIGG